MTSDEPSRPDPFGPGVRRLLDGFQPGEVRPPRPAATVVLLRDDATDGLQVYLMQRASTQRFMGGAYVFPGGRVDAKDPNPEAAAVRETEEEVSVRLDVRFLTPWSRWITPVIEPKRFDAHFFLAALPRGEEARAIPPEVTAGMWIAPGEAARRSEDRKLVLPPPTLWTLLELSGFTSVAEAFAAAPGRDPAPFAPRALELPGGRLAMLLAGDPAYEDPGSDPPAAAQRRLVLDDGRWVVFGGPTSARS